MKLNNQLMVICIFLFAFAHSDKCPEIKLQDDFKPADYMGFWYEQLRDEKFPFERYECATAKYTLNQNKSVYVFNSLFNDKQGKFETMEATAWFKGPIGVLKTNWFGPNGDYRVVSTDYTSYTVIYS